MGPWTTMLLVAVVLGGEPSLQPVHPKLQKPTPAKVREFLNSHRNDGCGPAFGPGEMLSWSCIDDVGECTGGSYSVAGGELSGECSYTAGVGWDDARSRPAREETFSMTLHWTVLSLSDDLMVYSDGRERQCWIGSRGGQDCPLLIEIIPGAAEKDLFNRVRERLRAWAPTWKAPVLFDGTQARTPRKVSEIRYREGSEGSAKVTAEYLAELTGPVTLALWEGPGLDADIAVVVGAARQDERKP